MNKKWKKVGALAFAGALAGSLLLAGCAGSGSGDSADNAGAASGDQATQEPVQIQIFAARSILHPEIWSPSLKAVLPPIF